MSRHHPLSAGVALPHWLLFPGAFLNTNDGPLFTTYHPTDKNHALIYLYCPLSE